MIGLLIVSHSGQAAAGIREIAMEMGGDEETIAAVGGDPDGGIGTSIDEIQAALSDLLEATDGVVVLVDLGSAVMNAETAIEMVEADTDAEIEIADAPIVEGALNAAASATSPKATVESVRESAEEAREISKL
ncbi:dihydroxyacetone kinase phosphoryl donor subunit DhaM [Halapricum desulfuricans]|uniref:phosphoenolpyruvate--glycerone phosphotransferase n=1 Tax=Halapricum desulfuricans TaxID=2841257 RepID=A0A897MZC3_9EURY|nr:dihydroxyacetone kinase phosphoryl donor subunit DhaM [Halapricum desulfuricans]QSG05348.1 Phosphoenolpyruvate-protein phosphoryltransferase, PTS system IIA component [Halapricum desulfuricans]